MRLRWRPLWTDENVPTPQEDKAAFFSLRLPAAPDMLWSHPRMTRLPEPTEEATIATHAAMNAASRQHSLVVLHTLWRWRTAPDRVEEIWTPDQASAILHNALRSSLRDLRWTRTAASAATPHTATAIQLIRDGAPGQDQPLSCSTRQGEQYLLFFDGGSRGNPGPGGAGAVVVRIASDGTGAEVIFSAARAFADPSTTNNQAEYEGLLAGLSAAAEHHWTPLSVVGDSMLIIRQMRTYTSPLNRILQGKYAKARRIADTLGVKAWDHHPRAANRMADAAANLAMDSKASSQMHHPTDHVQHQLIADLLPGDIAHWREGHPQ